MLAGLGVTELADGYAPVPVAAPRPRPAARTVGRSLARAGVRRSRVRCSTPGWSRPRSRPGPSCAGTRCAACAVRRGRRRSSATASRARVVIGADGADSVVRRASRARPATRPGTWPLAIRGYAPDARTGRAGAAHRDRVTAAGPRTRGRSRSATAGATSATASCCAGGRSAAPTCWTGSPTLLPDVDPAGLTGAAGAPPAAVDPAAAARAAGGCCWPATRCR